jgi:hypothetical protein
MARDCGIGELRREERFLTAQADHFTGVKWKEKASACSVRNDVVGVGSTGGSRMPQVRVALVAEMAGGRGIEAVA